MQTTQRTQLVLATLVLACHVETASADEWTFRHEHVLGTSLELRVDTPSRAAAKRAEELTLREIDRLSAILSRYDSASELMRWQRGELQSDQLSTDLVAVLQRADQWWHRSGGAFDVRVGAMLELWRAAEQQQRLPPAEQRRELCAQLAQPGWDVTANGEVVCHTTLPVSLDGLAKGYILDRVCDIVRRRVPELASISLNIGGDIRTSGDAAINVGVTDPRDAAVGAKPLASVVLKDDAAIATSGGYRRHFKIEGRRYSHIIDPRAGFPAGHLLSATVIAPNAVDADAAATTVSVLQPAEGLELVESLDGMECLLVLADGRLAMSSGWPTPQEDRDRIQFVSMDREETSQAKSGLLVDFTLNRPKGGRYRRPYVAIWLEDKDGYPVKTALLWLQTDQPGPRWHRDLTRWYRNDRLRKVAEQTALIGTVSGATRGPGEYQAHFDGTDNTGQPLPPGEYRLCLEVAREHGTYQLIREDVVLNGQSIERKDLKGNVEVSAASYEFIPPTPSNDVTGQE